ncbi:transcriptional repressor LexA [Anaerohalosphaera lusitana]|nr:transcriptional repressor LexA [Anaerohalosphaera lusitana]
MEVLKLIWEFENSQCYLPTIAEVSKSMGVSRTTAYEHIAAAREKGLIASADGKARSLSLTKKARTLLKKAGVYSEKQSRGTDEEAGVPLVGLVAAGAPIEAIENVERMSLGSMFGQRDDVFALEVQGDSMIEDGIFDGDLVICKTSSTAENGQLVIAIVEGDSATLKRFYREKNRIRLEPANAAYEPIYTDDCRIEARVLGLVRRMD